MNNKYLGDDDLVYNTAARIPVCLCLDVSGSMYDCIKELEEGVNKFYDAVRGSEQASLSCEIAVVTFSTGAKCLEDFSTVDRKEPLRLSASGGTDMTEGVELALKLLEDRKQDYKQAGVEYYQPWIVIMSDGEPNNRNSLKVVQERMKEMEAGKKLVVFSVGIGGSVDMNVLNDFSRRGAKHLKGFCFEEFFEWLSKSVEIVSQSKVGEKILIAPTSGWEEI